MTREDWMKNFGENLQDILSERRMRQRELYELTGIPSSTISDYIAGKVVPNAIAIIKFSHALDVDYFDLLDFGETID